MSPTDKVIYEISKTGADYVPILLGAFMLFSARFRRSKGKGRPPVTLYMRLFAGGIGSLLMVAAFER